VLWLLATGTGLAPFLSLIKDPETYERFEKVVIVHGCRTQAELAYRQMFEHELQEHEYLGELVRNQLLYYPTVTREKFRNEGRITELMASGKLYSDLGLPGHLDGQRPLHDLRQPSHAQGPEAHARRPRASPKATCSTLPTS
jgi:ferredoxin-NADP reductase